ncbi:MAG: AMIN-like domain-containing (lipo)protein [Haloechinothrix sp.]
MRKIGVAAAVLTLLATASCTGDPDPDDPHYFGGGITTIAPPTSDPAIPLPSSPPPSPSTGPPPATAFAGTSATASNAVTTGCAETAGWNTADDDEQGNSTDELVAVRVGKHECFDRVVFEIRGTAEAGFLVKYVPVVREDGSGHPVPVAGGAALQVIVRASIHGYPDGENILAEGGDYFSTAAQLAGWQSLKAVRFAGFFEGQSTTALGVRTELPFRAYSVVDSAAHTRKVIVDIAHQ